MVEVEGGELEWDPVWRAVGGELNALCERGLAHVVTEDVLRLHTILALQGRGIHGDRIQIEYRPEVFAGSLDLVIDAPPVVAVEFKFPRDLRGRPDTMTAGTLLDDLCRLSRLDVAEAWAAQLIGSRILGHLMRRKDVAWALSPGQVMELDDITVALLPETARRSLHSWTEGHRVVARCEGVYPAGEWSLFVHRVLPDEDGYGGLPASVVPPPRPPSDAQHRFHRAMIDIYDRARQEAGYTATRFIQMVSAQGGLAAAKALLHTAGVSEGFTALWERGRLDLTVEAHVLSPDFSALFTDEEREIARNRLREYGYEA